jgi:hypothetical protein
MKTTGIIEREFRYHLDWGPPAFFMLLFTVLAVGCAWFARVNTSALRLPGGLVVMSAARCNVWLWGIAAVFGATVVSFVRDASRQVRGRHRIAFTAAELLLPAGRWGAEVAVPYAALRGLYVKKPAEVEHPDGIVLSLRGRKFEIELFKLGSREAFQTILMLLHDRLDRPRVVPDFGSRVVRRSEGGQATPQYVVAGLPVGSGKLRTVINTFDDPEKARECAEFLRAGGKYHWVDVETPPTPTGLGDATAERRPSAGERHQAP